MATGIGVTGSGLSGRGGRGGRDPKPRGRVLSRERVCVALLVVLGFTLGCSEFSVIGIEPELSRDFGVSLAQVGTLMSSFAVAYAIATPVLALSTGRFRRFSLLIAYSALFCLANLVAMLATGFEALLFSRIVIGMVSGALLAVGVTYVPELVGTERTPLAMSFVYGAFSVAMVIATSLGKIVADLWHWHVVFVAVFVLSVVVSAALIAVLPRTGATDEPATVREQLCLVRDARVLSGMAIFIFGVGSVYTFYAYITPYLENILGLSTFGASAVLMVYGGICLASNLISGWCAYRFGLKSLRPLFVVQALLLVGLNAAGSVVPASLAAIFAVALSMYVLSMPCVTLFMAIARDEYPKALTLAASVEPMAFNVGIAFGTAVGGAVVTNVGMSALGLVGAAFSVVALALSQLTIRLVNKKKAARAAE